MLRFIVKADGNVSNIEVVRSLNKSMDKEAIRLIGSMPKWTPGKLHGMPVDCYYYIPIHFIAPDNKIQKKEKQ